MKIFFKSIGLAVASVCAVVVLYRLADTYLNKFRRNYITIESAHVNV